MQVQTEGGAYRPIRRLHWTMSYNKHGEYELCCWDTEANKYFISRDRAGLHVLREGSSDGKELFSPVGDDGKKNKKTGRVVKVELLYEFITERG